MLVVTHKVVRSSSSRDDSVDRCDSVVQVTLILRHHSSQDIAASNNILQGELPTKSSTSDGIIKAADGCAVSSQVQVILVL